MFSRCFHNHAFLKRKVHTIVAYGDSNTWGFDPRSQFTAVRFPFQELWTTHLEGPFLIFFFVDELMKVNVGYLGKRYRVVNEGLNGRTTTVSRLSPSDGDYDCNGRMNIKNVLHTHKPLHTVIIALGANDLNPKFHQSPHDVVSSIRALVRDVKNSVDIGEYCEEIHHTTSFKSLTTKNVNIVIMGHPLMHANGISKVGCFIFSIFAINILLACIWLRFGVSTNLLPPNVVDYLHY